MNAKELSQKIGCHPRTIYKMSPRKRKQWQNLAAKRRTMAWFDILSQLMFEVEAFNASKPSTEWLWFQISGVMPSVHHFKDGDMIYERYCHNVDQLTECLCYVYGLSGGVK